MSFSISKFIDLKALKPNKINASQLTYILAISFLSLGFFLFNGTFTAFEKATAQDIPILLRIIDPSFINNDFYTNSVVGSPRLVFSYIFYGLTLLGFDWYSALYFIKLLLAVCVPSLIFMTMYSVLVRWHPDLESHKHCDIAKIILLLGSIGFFAIAIEVSPIGRAFGWVSIQLFALNALNPMSLSFAVGLLYNFVSFQTKKISYFSSPLLLICTMIHPIVGIFHFIFSIIFKFPILFEKRSSFELVFDFILGVFPGIIFLHFLKDQSGSIDGPTFVEIYVNLRHSHHYLISTMFGWHSLFWISFILTPVLLSLIANKRKYLILSAAISMLFILAPIIQFLGTEIWKFKGVAIIGPSRLTAYVSIFWVLNTVIVGFSIYKNNVFLSFGKFILVLRFLFSFLNKMQNKQKLCSFIFLALFLIVFYSTHKHPLEYYEKLQARETTEWIRNNTKKDSVFFVQSFDGFLIRVYGRRAVFADYAFPFNEGDIKAFSERYKIYKNAKNFSAFDYACLSKIHHFNYLILPKTKTFSEHDQLYSNNKWAIYDMEAFNPKHLWCPPD